MAVTASNNIIRHLTHEVHSLHFLIQKYFHNILVQYSANWQITTGNRSHVYVLIVEYSNQIINNRRFQHWLVGLDINHNIGFDTRHCFRHPVRTGLMISGCHDNIGAKTLENCLYLIVINGNQNFIQASCLLGTLIYMHDHWFTSEGGQDFTRKTC